MKQKVQKCRIRCFCLIIDCVPNLNKINQLHTENHSFIKTTLYKTRSMNILHFLIVIFELNMHLFYLNYLIKGFILYYIAEEIN